MFEEPSGRESREPSERGFEEPPGREEELPEVEVAGEEAEPLDGDEDEDSSDEFYDANEKWSPKSR